MFLKLNKFHGVILLISNAAAAKRMKINYAISMVLLNFAHKF